MFVTRRALVLIAVCACSKDYDGKPYLDISMFNQAQKQARCTHDTRCLLFPDEATCVGASFETGYALDEATIANVYAGRTHYDGELAATCVAALAALSCDNTALDNRSEPASCSGVLVGLGSANAPCFYGSECRSGQCPSSTTDCTEGQNGVPTCCLGACLGDTPPITNIGLGSACFVGQCAVGTFCDETTLVCTTDLAAGSICTSSLECGDGLACIPQESGGASGCGVLPSQGEPCSFGSCRNENEYCDATMNTCAAYALPGESCAGPQQCSFPFLCDPSSLTCAAGAHVGESCVTAECFDAGTYCSPAQTCTAYLADGEMCDETTQCAGTCDPTTNKCVAQPCGSAT